MSTPMTVGDVLYGICNTRDKDLSLYYRELKHFLIRRGLLHHRESHDHSTKPP